MFYFLKIGLVADHPPPLATRFTLPRSATAHRRRRRRLWLFLQPLVVALGQRVDDRDHKVGHHQNDKLLKDARQQVAATTGTSACRPLLAMQMGLLVVEERLEGLLEHLADHGNVREQVNRLLDERLVERNHHKDLLDVHLDDGLADQRGPEERPEGDQEVAASDSRQIKQRIRNLRGGGESRRRRGLRGECVL